jgi:hypothetical protein
MMKALLYIFLLFPVLTFAQDSGDKINKEKIDQKSNIQKKGNTIIANYFSVPVILAYQEKAVAVIQDFYNYANLYQNEERSPQLSIEINKSINNLFWQDNIQVKNIFEQDNQTITLKSFLSKCKENKATFSVSNFHQNPEVNDAYFTFQYTLLVQQNSKTVEIPIKQKVYFFPGVKEFGSQQKKVWQLKLGEF